MLALSFALIAFYYYFVLFPDNPPGGDFFFNHFFGLWLWLYETPALFYIPDALLYCGFNRTRYDSLHQNKSTGRPVLLFCNQLIMTMFFSLSARAGAYGRRGYKHIRHIAIRW